jgi:hypothetical protein
LSYCVSLAEGNNLLLMQDCISSHPERIDSFKVALWNLIQWGSAGHQLYIPDNGRVEPYGSEDSDEVGSLGWIQDWCIRPVAVKSFYKFHLRGRLGVSKYRRELPLSTLYKIEDADDYYYCPKYYQESTYRSWSQYVKSFIDSRRVEREFWFSIGLDPGPTEYPSDQDVKDILLLASQFTSQTSPTYRPPSPTVTGDEDLLEYCTEVLDCIKVNNLTNGKALKKEKEFGTREWQMIWLARQATLMIDYIEEHARGQAEIEVVN